LTGPGPIVRSANCPTTCAASMPSTLTLSSVACVRWAWSRPSSVTIGVAVGDSPLGPFEDAIGGPLISMSGEVMGVNSMAARNGSIGFAIPINLVKGLLPQLAEKGRVEWGWLGVTIGEIGEDEAPKYGLAEPRGVLIRNVVVGQPADKGGVKANDVILGVDGASLEGPRDLQRIISSTPVGKVVKIALMREGKETEVAVTVGAYQAQPTPRVPRRMVPAPRPPAPQQPR